MNNLHAEVDLLYQQLNIPTGTMQLNNTLNLGKLGKLNRENAFSESNSNRTRETPVQGKSDGLKLKKIDLH